MRWAFLSLLLFAPEALSVSESGVDIMNTPSERLHPPFLLAPGAPPVLGFRYFDARDRGRFTDLGLMTDDAGH